MTARDPAREDPRMLLEASSVTKKFGSGQTATLAVRGCSCQLRRGELVLLMGPSGSGKTTLISMLAGLMKPTEGRLYMCGRFIEGMREEELARLRRRRLGFVFQSYNLLQSVSALENVAQPLHFRSVKRDEALARSRAELEKFGLAALGKRLPAQLSGGQQQRVAIARALVGLPEVVIGDEVTAALDSESARIVMDSLRAYVTERTSVLLVTHDSRLGQWADRVIEMRDGRVATSMASANQGGGQ
jgi:putative ABC transport system ATP-binding protein